MKSFRLSHDFGRKKLYNMGVGKDSDWKTSLYKLYWHKVECNKKTFTELIFHGFTWSVLDNYFGILKSYINLVIADDNQYG